MVGRISKKNLANVLIGLAVAGESLLGLSWALDGKWLERNSREKGWRYEGNYRVVDYDYYERESGRRTKGALALFGLGALGMGLYYRKRNEGEDD